MKTASESRAGIFYEAPAGSRDDKDLVNPTRVLIQRTELPLWYVRVTLLTMCALVLMALIWSIVTRIDVVAEASGSLVPIGKVRQVRAQRNGSVASLRVKEGDLVKQGDVLARLDGTNSNEELKIRRTECARVESVLKQRRSAMSALEEVIESPGQLPLNEAEIDNVSQVIEKVFAAYLSYREAQHDMHTSAASARPGHGFALNNRLVQVCRAARLKTTMLDYRREDLQLHLKNQEEKIRVTIMEIGAQKEALQKTESILQKSSKQAAALEKLEKEGAVAMFDCLEGKKRVESEERSIIEARAKIARLQSELIELQLEKRRLIADGVSQGMNLEAEISMLHGQTEEVNIQIRDLQRRFMESSCAFHAALDGARRTLTKQRLEIRQNELEQSKAQAAMNQALHECKTHVITAPAAGIVSNLRVTGVHQLVESGELLLNVVPAKSALTAEIKVKGEDIAFVEKGQTVKMKVDSFPFQDFGLLTGKVIEIEQHAQHADRSSAAELKADVDSSFYMVRVLADRDWFLASGKKLKLLSGAPLKAEIVLRQQSVMDIVLEPLRRRSYVHWN